VFGTLLRSSQGIGKQYAIAATKHLNQSTKESEEMEETHKRLEKAFRKSVTSMDRAFPTFGHSTDMSSKDWWFKVIQDTFIEAGTRESVIGTSAFQEMSQELYDGFGTDAKRHHVYPDVLKCLEKLQSQRRNGLQIGVLSNIDPRLSTLLETLQLRQFFDIVMTSYDVGVSKPQPQIYHAMLKAANLSTGEATNGFTQAFILDRANPHASPLNSKHQVPASDSGNSANKVRTISDVSEILEYIQE